MDELKTVLLSTLYKTDVISRAYLEKFFPSESYSERFVVDVSNMKREKETDLLQHHSVAWVNCWWALEHSPFCLFPVTNQPHCYLKSKIYSNF